MWLIPLDKDAIMVIIFSRGRDKEAANDTSKLRRMFRGNQRRAENITLRLQQMRAADNLHTLSLIPQAYCHELKGDRKGQFAVRLDGRWRLIFEAANDPIPRKADGGLDWVRVTEIRILEMAVDYHD